MVTGEQQTPKEGSGIAWPRRDSLNDAKKFFDSKYPSSPSCNLAILDTLCSRFLISFKYYETLSHRFQSILSGLGQLVVGDEKLMKFTGASNDVRQILTKPDKIGLWFYEL
jgi:hypothetical protein